MTREGGPIELLPEINECGKTVLYIVDACRKNARYNYPGNVYEWLNDPIIPDFGDLNDLNTLCKLTINDYYTPDLSIDDYNETRKDVLLFDKKMVIEALSKVEPNKTVVVTGKGRAVHHFERGGFEYVTKRDKMVSDIDNEVEVTLAVRPINTPNPDCVSFTFDSKPVNPGESFTIHRSILLTANRSISS